MAMVRRLLSLSPELDEKVCAYSKEHEMSVCGMIRLAIVEFFKSRERKA